MSLPCRIGKVFLDTAEKKVYNAPVWAKRLKKNWLPSARLI